MKTMSFVGNFLWFIFGGGFVFWFLWVFFGVFMFLTIIGIPFSIAAFRISKFAAFPFGKDLIDCHLIGKEKVCGTFLANVLWVVFFGFWISLGHMIAGIGLFISIIGIPFGFAHFKIACICFNPLGKLVVKNSTVEKLGKLVEC